MLRFSFVVLLQTVDDLSESFLRSSKPFGLRGIVITKRFEVEAHGSFDPRDESDCICDFDIERSTPSVRRAGKRDRLGFGVLRRLLRRLHALFVMLVLCQKI